MVKALVAMGAVSSADDPRVKVMSAEGVAQMVADRGLDGKMAVSPSVAETIQLAKRVVEGDEDAAREVAARNIAEQVCETEQEQKHKQTARAAVSGKTIARDREFGDQVKDTMVKALVAIGAVSSADDPRAQAMTAEDAAQMVGNTSVDTATIADPSVVEAVRLAQRVALGDADAAREVVAQTFVEQARQAERWQKHNQTARAAVAGQTMTQGGWLRDRVRNLGNLWQSVTL